MQASVENEALQTSLDRPDLLLDEKVIYPQSRHNGPDKSFQMAEIWTAAE